MLIDTHAHLTDPVFDSDRNEVIARAAASGVDHIIEVSYDLGTAQRSIQLVRDHKCVSRAVGVHPNESAKFTGKYEEEFWAAYNSADKVAVGEIGLDYYRDTAPRSVQQKVFDTFLRKSVEDNLPVIIHNRDADDDILKTIRAYPKDGVTGVFHCFSGTADFAKKVIDLGFYVSFAGPLTFPSAKELKATARAVPIEKTLVETDAPYLAPQKFRGKRNEPSHVRYVAEELAAIKGLSYEDVCRITTFNVKNLFGVGVTDRYGKIAYPIRDSLYLNITNSCTNACTFCVRYYSDYVKGHNLRLRSDPDYHEIIAAIGDPTRYKEVVFCGYGEPLARLDIVKKVAAYLKGKGLPVRIDTNGHANLIHGRPVAAELKGLVDAVSISLNADTREKYDKICQPEFGPGTFDEVKKFVLQCKDAIPRVTVTVVDLPGIDIEECKKIAAQELGVELKIRKYDEVG